MSDFGDGLENVLRTSSLVIIIRPLDANAYQLNITYDFEFNIKKSYQSF